MNMIAKLTTIFRPKGAGKVQEITKVTTAPKATVPKATEPKMEFNVVKANERLREVEAKLQEYERLAENPEAIEREMQESREKLAQATAKSNEASAKLKVSMNKARESLAKEPVKIAPTPKQATLSEIKGLKLEPYKRPETTKGTVYYVKSGEQISGQKDYFLVWYENKPYVRHAAQGSAKLLYKHGGEFIDGMPGKGMKHELITRAEFDRLLDEPISWADLLFLYAQRDDDTFRNVHSLLAFQALDWANPVLLRVKKA